MKNFFILPIFIFSFSVNAGSIYKYEGPFVVNALKSNEGIIEMTVPRDGTVAVIFKGCDRVKSIDVGRFRNMIRKSIYSGGKSATLTNNFGSKTTGVFPINIITNEGLMHTLVLIPAPEDYKVSGIQLKVVIKNTFKCKSS